MKRFELLALLPRSDSLPDIAGLQHVRTSGYMALLSDVPRAIMALPQSRKQALSTAATRQALLEKCMGRGPLIVCRPHYHIARTEIAGLISANRPLLDRLALRLCDKVQYQVSVSWTPDAVLNRFRDTEELAPLFRAKQVSPESIERAVCALAERLADQITQSLYAVSVEMLRLPNGPDMLCNLVLLLDEGEISKLDQAVEAIDAIWTEGFRIKQIGPAPAASFVLLDPKTVSPDEVSAAFKHLGLLKNATADDIARARKHALQRAPQHAAYSKHCADIAHAALHATCDGQPLILCTVHSEDQAGPTAQRQVA